MTLAKVFLVAFLAGAILPYLVAVGAPDQALRALIFKVLSRIIKVLDNSIALQGTLER